MLPYPKTVIALSKEARAAVDKAMASRGETWDTYSSRGVAPHVVSEDVVKRAEGMVADSRRLSRLGTGETPETSKLLGRSVMNTAVGSQRADLDIALNLFASGDERSEMRRREFLNAGQARPARRFRRALSQVRERVATEVAQRRERAATEAAQRREMDGAGLPGTGEYPAYRAATGAERREMDGAGLPAPSDGPAPSVGSYGLMSREMPYYSAGPASRETPRANPYRLPARLTDFASESHAPVNGVPVMFAPDKAKREWLEDLDARRRASFERWYRGVQRVESGIDDFNAIVAAAGGAVGVIGSGTSAAGAGGGARFSPNPNWYATHRTPQRVLDRIDAARKAAGVNTYNLYPDLAPRPSAARPRGKAARRAPQRGLEQMLLQLEEAD